MKHQKTVYENYLQRIALMTKDGELTPLTPFPEYKEFFGPMFERTPIMKQCLRALESHYLNGFKNYVIADRFYEVMLKAADRINVSNIPSIDCFNEVERTYQLSLPLAEHDFIIDFHGTREKFNITINRFRRNPVPHLDDFDFWRLIGGEDRNCQDMIDDFMASPKVIAGSKEEILTVLKEQFSLIINLVLYINSGEPDLRKLKGHNGKGIKFGGKNRISKIRRYSESSFVDATIVGFSYKKITEVDPYVKWQHYGPMSTLRRLQIISGYEKKGKEYKEEK